MRIWMIALLTAVVGTASGFAIARTEFAGVVEYFEPVSREPTEAVKSSRSGTTGPRAAVDGGPKYVFDTIAFGATETHAFVVRNNGDERLQLDFDHPSCGMCIEVDDKYQQVSIQPGQSAEVVVKYGAKKGGDTFDEAAFFRTNDPLVPVLRFDISGIVTQAAKMIPNELTLGSLLVSEGAATTIKLLGYRSEKMELVQHVYSDPAIAEYFEITTAPMSREDVAAADKYATCGLLATLKIKPGLPLGALNQMITFQCRADEDHNLELRVSGEVVGDISIIGKDYNSAQDSLSLGINKKGMGRTSTVHLLVKGPHRDGVKVSVAEVDPAEVVKVTVGEGDAVGDGRAVKFPIKVELLKDAPAMNRLGNAQGAAGRLVIVTTHPTASRIVIQLRFAVE